MQAALLSLINIDSTKGNSILLYTVKNTTWINFTISQFSVLIKKQRSPLKKSISTKEAKERIPLPVYRPAALSIQRHAWRCFWAFLLYTYSTSVEQKIWYSLSRICRDYFFFLPLFENRQCRETGNMGRERGMTRNKQAVRAPQDYFVIISLESWKESPDRALLMFWNSCIFKWVHVFYE